MTLGGVDVECRSRVTWDGFFYPSFSFPYTCAVERFGSYRATALVVASKQHLFSRYNVDRDLQDGLPNDTSQAMVSAGISGCSIRGVESLDLAMDSAQTWQSFSEDSIPTSRSEGANNQGLAWIQLGDNRTSEVPSIHWKRQVQFDNGYD